jgi:hypothetical protein
MEIETRKPESRRKMKTAKGRKNEKYENLRERRG